MGSVGVREVAVEQVKQRLERLHRAHRVGRLPVVRLGGRPGRARHVRRGGGGLRDPAGAGSAWPGAARSPKLVNLKAARPAGAVVNVALNGSAALASLSAVTAYP